MLQLFLRLVRLLPFYQFLLAALTFTCLLLLIAVKLMYGFGLSGALSKSLPHVEFEPDRFDSAGKRSFFKAQAELEKEFKIEAVSAYRLTAPLSVKLEVPGGITGWRYEAGGAVEFLGLELSSYPFVVPLELASPSTDLLTLDFLTPKELVYNLMRSPRAVMVNRAMAGLFQEGGYPKQVTNLSLEINGQPSGEIRFMGVIDDLLEVPRIYGSLDWVRQFEAAGSQGYYLRLQHQEEAQKVAAQLRKKLQGQGRVVAWSDGQTQPQKLYRVFVSVFWLLVIGLSVLSLFAAALTVYRSLVIKRKALAILRLLGMSRRSLYSGLLFLYGSAITAGFGAALGIVRLAEPALRERLVTPMTQVVPLSEFGIPWGAIAQFGSGFWVLYLVGFAGFLALIVDDGKQIQ